MVKKEDITEIAQLNQRALHRFTAGLLETPSKRGKPLPKYKAIASKSWNGTVGASEGH